MSKIKIKLLRLLRLSFMLASGVLFIVVLASSVKKQQTQVCESINIYVDYNSGNMFIEERDVLDLLKSNNFNSLIGKNLIDINYSDLESSLENNSYINNAEVYSDLRGGLHLQIIQKQPFVRIINNRGVSYYLDEKGDKIPLSHKFTPRLLIVSVSEEKSQSYKGSILRLASDIYSDNFLASIIDQVIITEDDEVELISLIDGHRIILSHVAEDYKAGLDKLKTFYQDGLKNVGWKKYNTINLKYKDQIICLKN